MIVKSLMVRVLRGFFPTGSSSLFLMLKGGMRFNEFIVNKLCAFGWSLCCYVLCATDQRPEIIQIRRYVLFHKHAPLNMHVTGQETNINRYLDDNFRTVRPDSTHD